MPTENAYSKPEIPIDLIGINPGFATSRSQCTGRIYTDEFVKRLDTEYPVLDILTTRIRGNYPAGRDFVQEIVKGIMNPEIFNDAFEWHYSMSGLIDSILMNSHDSGRWHPGNHDNYAHEETIGPTNEEFVKGVIASKDTRINWIDEIHDWAACTGQELIHPLVHVHKAYAIPSQKLVDHLYRRNLEISGESAEEVSQA